MLDWLSNWLLRDIIAKLDQILLKENSMWEEMQALIAEVNEVKTVEAGAVATLTTLIERVNNLADQIEDNTEAKVMVMQLAEDLKAATEPLAAAIANVPIEPAEVPSAEPATEG